MPTATNTLAGKPAGKDESQLSSTSRKASSARPQEPPVKCPRCDSPNTKFCYYNNYSLTQPRHFCKTCRRYWTKGGALRNVPIGGGCRKNKKMKSSPRLSADSKDSSGSSDAAAGLKFFHGLSPAMDFQINMPPKLHPTTTTNIFHQFPSFDNLSNTSAAISQTPCFNLDPSSLMGFTFPLPSSSLKHGENLGFQEMGTLNAQSNLASSIESLSSINQDLHWKLQQQRLATLFAEDGRKEGSGSFQKLQPIQFQNLENPKADSCLNIETPRKDGNFSNNEWFLNSSYATAAAAPAAGGGNSLNGNAAGNWSGGIQAWSELTQYASLP